MFRVLFSLLARLRRDDAAAVLPMFAITLVALLLITAAGVDFGSALVVKQKLTNAADAAALAVGADPTLTQEEADARGQAYIKAHYPDEDFGDLMEFHVVPTASQVDVTVRARIPTTFLRVARIDTLDITVHSQVLRQQRDLEVVLVLDNTTSMSMCSGPGCTAKINQLKTAANKLVTILFGDGATSEHVKMGLVPFSGAVNIGSNAVTAHSSWLDLSGSSFLQTEDVDLPANRTLLDAFASMRRTSWGGCVRARLKQGAAAGQDDLDLTDTPPGVGDTRWVPYFAPDEPDSGGYSNNYIDDKCTRDCTETDRQRNYAKYSGATPDTRGLRGPNGNCVPRPIQPLTNVKSTITEAITAMTASGYTVIPAGLSWGWKVLSPDEPYTEGAPYSEQRVAKALILLTDGRNQIEPDHIEPGSSNGQNHSTFSAYGYAASGHLGSTDGSQAHQKLDDKTAALCAAIKANKDDVADDQDIYIYTITFQIDDAGTRTLMQDCATPPADCPGDKCYYDSPTGADLDDAFESIALGLNKLRVAQ